MIILSRAKHSMGGVALQLLAKKAELRRRMEKTRARLNEKAKPGQEERHTGDEREGEEERAYRRRKRN